MYKFIIAGIGTGVGKTIVSAILTCLTNGNYWKPIQTGVEEDSDTLKRLVGKNHRIYEPAYRLNAPLSPHHAARLQNISIDISNIAIPESTSPLIIESVGGIYVPLSSKVLSMDLFKTWNCRWIVVSRHYLGSINHTLLTLDALKRNGITVLGLIFNGQHERDTETAILEISKIALLGRLLPEKHIDSTIIQRYARKWQPSLSKLLS